MTVEAAARRLFVTLATPDTLPLKLTARPITAIRMNASSNAYSESVWPASAPQNVLTIFFMSLLFEVTPFKPSPLRTHHGAEPYRHDRDKMTALVLRKRN